MEKKMILSCPTLKKELLKAAEEAGFQGEIRFITQSLHSSPMELQKYLQNMIDQWKIWRKFCYVSPAAEERLPVLRPYMLRWSYLRPETVWIFSCPGRI